MGISGSEIFLIFLVILLLFGADKLPELARTFGKGMNEFKKAADDIKREISESATDIKDDLLEARRLVDTETHVIKKELQTPVGYDPYDLTDESTDYKADEPEIKTTRKRNVKAKTLTKTDLDNPAKEIGDEVDKQ